MKKISLVIPAYNEEVNIPIIREKIQEIFQAQLPNYSYEIIFVNDGSRDNSQEVLEKLAQNFSEVKYLEFSRNFGHQAALKAGLNHVDISSNAAVSLDCDLQHPPSFIPQLVEKWEEGYDLVFTLRRYDVSESFFKKFTSNLYYNILAKLSDFKFERGEGKYCL